MRRTASGWRICCDHGLLKGSFVPDRPQRELRELTRYRTSLAGERASELNRRPNSGRVHSALSKPHRPAPRLRARSVEQFVATMQHARRQAKQMASGGEALKAIQDARVIAAVFLFTSLATPSLALASPQNDDEVVYLSDVQLALAGSYFEPTAALGQTRSLR
jgi:hypothetical protein